MIKLELSSRKMHKLLRQGGATMGLFINKMEHQAVFKNTEEIKAPNQSISKIDPIAEFMEEQKMAYDSLQKHCQALEKMVEKQSTTQQYQSKEIGIQLNELKATTADYEKFEGLALDQLTELTSKIDTTNKTNKVIINQLGKFEAVNEELVTAMNEQSKSQEKLSDQLAEQKFDQNQIATRLDNQEALLEKVVRQLDYLRSTLFERTHFLAEKIEEGYDLTSSYIYKLLTSSNEKDREKPRIKVVSSK